ncbi:MAG: ABC transporter ATP-binding protein [Lachnospiraceae bacterium]|nr:ABC transporter ATP-binding protein [Lachnospiraceae bacterium]
MHELTLDKVSKEYKGKKAVNNINVTLTHGVYGLLGENGAGKTTLMRMICGLLEKSEGKILCDGTEIEKMGGSYRRLLGYLPQDFGYYPDYSAWRFLMYMAALKALPDDYAGKKVTELLELVNLIDVKDKKLKTFSGGMLKRVGIAQALLNEPEILILDEPTSGLDPKERVRFRNIISSLSKDRIIILSTHIVSDIEYIADNILMMKSGKLAVCGTPDEMIKPVKQAVWECTIPQKDSDQFSAKYLVSNLKNVEQGVLLRIVSDTAPTADALNVAPTLEDAYLYYLSTECGLNTDYKQ